MNRSAFTPLPPTPLSVSSSEDDISVAFTANTFPPSAPTNISVPAQSSGPPNIAPTNRATATQALLSITHFLDRVSATMPKEVFDVMKGAMRIWECSLHFEDTVLEAVGEMSGLTESKIPHCPDDLFHSPLRNRPLTEERGKALVDSKIQQCRAAVEHVEGLCAHERRLKDLRERSRHTSEMAEHSQRFQSSFAQLESRVKAVRASFEHQRSQNERSLVNAISELDRRSSKEFDRVVSARREITKEASTEVLSILQRLAKIADEKNNELMAKRDRMHAADDFDPMLESMDNENKLIQRSLTDLRTQMLALVALCDRLEGVCGANTLKGDALFSSVRETMRRVDVTLGFAIAPAPAPAAYSAPAPTSSVSQDQARDGRRNPAGMKRERAEAGPLHLSPESAFSPAHSPRAQLQAQLQARVPTAIPVSKPSQNVSVSPRTPQATQGTQSNPLTPKPDTSSNFTFFGLRNLFYGNDADETSDDDMVTHKEDEIFSENAHDNGHQNKRYRSE